MSLRKLNAPSDRFSSRIHAPKKTSMNIPKKNYIFIVYAVRSRTTRGGYSQISRQAAGDRRSVLKLPYKKGTVLLCENYKLNPQLSIHIYANFITLATNLSNLIKPNYNVRDELSTQCIISSREHLLHDLRFGSD